MKLRQDVRLAQLRAMQAEEAGEDAREQAAMFRRVAEQVQGSGAGAATPAGSTRDSAGGARAEGAGAGVGEGTSPAPRPGQSQRAARWTVTGAAETVVEMGQRGGVVAQAPVTEASGRRAREDILGEEEDEPVGGEGAGAGAAHGAEGLPRGAQRGSTPRAGSKKASGSASGAHDARLRSLRNELAAVQEALRKVKAEWRSPAEWEEAQAELEAAREAVKAARQEAARRAKSATTFRTARQEAMSCAEEASRERDALRERVKRLEAELQRREERATELRRRVEQLQAAEEKANVRAEEAERRAREAAAQDRSRRSAMSALRSRLDSRRKEEKKVAEAEARVAEVEAARRKDQRAFDRAQSSLRATQVELESTKREFAAFRARAKAWEAGAEKRLRGLARQSRSSVGEARDAAAAQLERAVEQSLRLRRGVTQAVERLTRETEEAVLAVRGRPEHGGEPDETAIAREAASVASLLGMSQGEVRDILLAERRTRMTQASPARREAERVGDARRRELEQALTEPVDVETLASLLHAVTAEHAHWTALASAASRGSNQEGAQAAAAPGAGPAGEEASSSASATAVRASQREAELRGRLAELGASLAHYEALVSRVREQVGAEHAAAAEAVRQYAGAAQAARAMLEEQGVSGAVEEIDLAVSRAERAATRAREAAMGAASAASVLPGSGEDLLGETAASQGAEVDVGAGQREPVSPPASREGDSLSERGSDDSVGGEGATVRRGASIVPPSSPTSGLSAEGGARREARGEGDGAGGEQ